MFVKFIKQAATAYGYFNQDDTFYITDPAVSYAWIEAGLVAEIAEVTQDTISPDKSAQTSQQPEPQPESPDHDPAQEG